MNGSKMRTLLGEVASIAMIAAPHYDAKMNSGVKLPSNWLEIVMSGQKEAKTPEAETQIRREFHLMTDVMLSDVVSTRSTQMKKLMVQQEKAFLPLVEVKIEALMLEMTIALQMLSERMS